MDVRSQSIKIRNLPQGHKCQALFAVCDYRNHRIAVAAEREIYDPRNSIFVRLRIQLFVYKE